MPFCVYDKDRFGRGGREDGIVHRDLRGTAVT
jgi:hypothetical protein